jgi:hypothetical protein
VPVARSRQLQGTEKFAPQVRLGAGSEFARVISGAYFEKQTFDWIAEP